LYVVTAFLVRNGMDHRILFPVRSRFFYDQPLGLFVNGVMSFFAMYPPIFRERKRLPLNVASLDELTWMLRRGGVFAGIHPEGTRKLDDDPYTFLPAQPGVGRVIHGSRSTVIPVFVNGLINDLKRQVASNFDGSGRPIHVVFGKPLEITDLLARPGSPRLYKSITEHAMSAISTLAQEERRIRSLD
jgi:1-acyl-sn-glycerol-3-phosphate acyltransferase